MIRLTKKLLFAIEAAIQRGMPRLDLWALPLLPWGYFQYHLVGRYRTRLGGGGPGLSNPPERIVEAGIYRWMRNPMYLGHIIFFVGLAPVTRIACRQAWFRARRATGARDWRSDHAPARPQRLTRLAHRRRPEPSP